VAVVEAREDSVKAPVRERQLERVALDEARGRHLAPRLVEHLRGLVEAREVAVEMPRQEAGAAGDIERRRRRQRRDLAEQDRHFLEPVAAVAMREAAAPEPHVVVLGRPSVVVLSHGS
jgi:hypothetical protein